MSFAGLPEGWQVWNDESGGRAILVYRPDVFDTEQFPAPCLPTIYVTDTPRTQRPESVHRSSSTWYVTLFLEPEVDAGTEEYDTREAACDGAVAYADRFAAGEVDYRGCYQVPREAYLARLDDLVGGEGTPTDG